MGNGKLYNIAVKSYTQREKQLIGATAMLEIHVTDWSKQQKKRTKDIGTDCCTNYNKKYLQALLHAMHLAWKQAPCI